MTHSSKTPWRIALHGMDSRTCKGMEIYLKGPCRGIAVIAAEAEAEIDMLDADCRNAKELLESRKAKTPQRPLILLSLEHLQIENTFFIQKPLNVEKMEAVLKQIKAFNTPKRKVLVEAVHIADTPAEVEPPAPQQPASAAQQLAPATAAKTDIEVYLKKPAGVKSEENAEHHATVKHQSAMQQNEGGFTAYLGILDDIDFNNPEQLLTACFDPRLYFLASVQSAYKTAKLQDCPLMLNSIWKPLFIFPETQEIWLDADDKQLRAFAGITINKSSAHLTLSAAKPELRVSLSMDKFLDMQAFLWKLTIWTSKGRFPLGLDMHRPVYLKRWPNFTRLVITPDALRIAAVLVKAPRSPLDVASVLRVNPQHVFVFVSACYMLGLLGQSVRQVDSLIAPEAIKKPKNESLLSKILHKLRGD
jgi:hypothetical protein